MDRPGKLEKPYRSKSQVKAALSVFFLDNFGIAVVYPIFTPLILDVAYGISTPEMAVSTRVLLLGLLIAAFPLAQFLGGPIIGNTADIYGRRRAFFYTLIGEAFGYTLSGIGVELKSYSLLLFSRLLTGFFAANLVLCLATIADHRKEIKKRTSAIGLLATIGGLSFVVAILVGGEFSDRFFAKHADAALPFWITAFLSLLNLLIIALYYRNSRKEKPTGHFFSHFKPVFKQKRLFLLFAGYFFFILGWIPALQFLSLYMIQNYGTSKEIITLVFLGVGLSWMLSSSLINRMLTGVLSPKGLATSAAFFTAFSLLPLSAHLPFYSFVIFYQFSALFAALTWTGITAYLSASAPTHIQGKMMGAGQGVAMLAIIAGPLVGGALGSYGSRPIYLFISCSLFISFILLMIKFILSERSN